jgi:excisionase family DNA binding protein
VSGPTLQYPKYVSVAEASATVGVSPRTLRRAIDAQRLRSHRLGRLVRIDLTELKRWIEANGAPAVESPLGLPGPATDRP